ncbi:MAG: hypothetical protein COA88_11340 [Kordia sp.]|nr:MAG: hypothetical protein COA88_11340 [Kordia sp.]
MKNLLLLAVAFTFISCKKETKVVTVKEKSTKSRFYKTKEELKYNRSAILYAVNDSVSEQLEIYVSKKNDSIFNQIKRFKHNAIDTLNSTFYDLKVSSTEKPNVYKAEILLFNKFNNFEITKTRERKVTFHYTEQSSDSLIISTVKSKTNKLEFEYLNVDNKHITGVLIDEYNNDTIVNNEKMVRMREFSLLVDYHTDTDNLFVEPYEFHENNRLDLHFNPSSLTPETTDRKF